MNALLWNERFLTGLANVDAEHATLIALINELGKQTTQQATIPPAQLEVSLQTLVRYASSHFATEEKLMREEKLDERFIKKHQAEHARFLRDVAQMKGAEWVDAPDSAQLLLRFLFQWLAFHVLDMDKALARQVARVQAGLSAEAAWSAESEEVDAPADLLLTALDDLLRVVARRNVELVENNRLLEARVSERTAALEASNAQLRATVDALRETQVKLIENEKLASVGQLAAGLAHEINNPLAFITANLSVLEEHAGALFKIVDVAQAGAPLVDVLREAEPDFIKKDVGELLAETREGVTRVQTIVRDLRSFSHLDGGPVLDLDLQACVESTLRVLAARGRSGLSLVTQFGPATRVRCQAAQVSHVVLNLMQNAIAAVHDTGARGTITVRTGSEGEFGFVEVKDSGVGMSPEVLAHAFEPFFTTRPAGTATGLGLTSALSCAQAHGGRLEASSVPGVGTVMRLLLPLEAQEAMSRPREFERLSLSK
jgi:two-component system, NtrC family, sensor kinase